MSSYLRIDGDETALRGARLTWQRARSGEREGVLFHVTAHGGRHMLRVTAFAAGPDVAALSSKTVDLAGAGPDAAIDGRLFVHGDVRFGRVTDTRAVLSLDGVVDGLDPAVEARATVEADVRCAVMPAGERRHCLSCGGPLARWAEDVEQLVGGHRIVVRTVPALCGECRGYVGAPRHCPGCAAAYAPDEIHTLVDEDGVDWWATCAAGHTFSGTLVAERA